MRQINKIPTIIFLLIAIFSMFMCNAPTKKNNDNPDPVINHDDSKLNILFIGASYFSYNNLPGTLQEIASLYGKEIVIGDAIDNGNFLYNHTTKNSTIAKIKEKQWDYVILQGVGRLVAYPDTTSISYVKNAISNLKTKIKDNCPTTKIIFCLPWAFEDGMTWLEGWDDTYQIMQEKVLVNTKKYSEELDFIIAPVGWAFYQVMNEIIELHYLYMSDYNHPSHRGTFLMACVLYSTLYQKPVENVRNMYDLPLGEIEYLKEIGSSTVLDSLEFWNISQ